MENRVFSLFGNRTMDVLFRFDQSPRSLHDQCLDLNASLTLQALWLKYASQVESRNASFYLRTTEEELSNWFSILTLDLRRQVLDATSKLIISNLGGGNSTTASGVGGRILFSPPNPASVLLASLLEIFFDPFMKKCTLYNELQWNKESRVQVLHLLHQRPSSLKELDLACYKSPHFRFQPIPFSEKFILAGCFGRFPQLRILIMPNICDDDLLAKVGESCTLIEELDLSGSFGVTNQGIKWFCQKSSHKSSSGLFASKKQLDISKRVGYVRTPIASCCSKRQFSAKSRKVCGTKQSNQDDDDDDDDVTKFRLKRVDLTGTSMDYKGLELILSECKNLVAVSVDDDLWSSLFSTLSDDGSGCIDCVGTAHNLAAFNMLTNVANFLPVIFYLFPNVQHLTLTSNLSDTLGFLLPHFEKQTSLTIKDIHFDRLRPSLSLCGERIRRLIFCGKASEIDIGMLDSTCPNLETLGVTHSLLVLDSSRNQGETGKHKRLQKLKICKLWDLHQMSDNWKTLVKWATNLETLYLWNIPISDADLNDIMTQNPLSCLKDIRIGATEIGFVRLNDASATKLTKACPNLKSLGGLCDWRIRDLLSLLQTLLIEGGWRITLEPQQTSTMMW